MNSFGHLKNTKVIPQKTDILPYMLLTSHLFWLSGGVLFRSSNLPYALGFFYVECPYEKNSYWGKFDEKVI